MWPFALSSLAIDRRLGIGLYPTNYLIEINRILKQKISFINKHSLFIFLILFLEISPIYGDLGYLIYYPHLYTLFP